MDLIGGQAVRTEAVSGSACVAGSRWTVMYTEALGGPARRLTGGAASLVCSWLAPATRDPPHVTHHAGMHFGIGQGV